MRTATATITQDPILTRIPALTQITSPGHAAKRTAILGVKFDAKIALGLVHDKESLHTGDLVFNKTGMNPQMKTYYLGPFDLAYWIAIFFKVLTTVVLGLFTGMVILDFLSRLKIQRRW